jgi:hypothetical protein
MTTPTNARQPSEREFDLVQRLRGAGAVALGRDEHATIRDAADEIERLRAEVARLQHEADAAAERHVTIAETRADIAERELAALRERIASAPVRDTYVEGEHGRELVWLSDDGAMPAEYKGKRVRLVVED